MSTPALAHFIPSFLGDLVLSPDDQAATAANANRPAVRVVEDAAPEQPRHTRVVPTRRDGSAYAGDFLEDVMAYRELRARSLCGEVVGSEELDRLTQLEAKFRQPRDGTNDEAAVLRSFYRFDCAFMAEIGDAGGFSVYAIEDISAGGIKAVGSHGYEPGDTVSFRVAQHGRVLEFPARVAWCRGEDFGLMFAGAARFVAR